MENMSLSDIAAVTKDNDNWGGAGGWIWIIVLFLFMYGNGWNRNTTAQTQKILDALAQDKIESLQAQISELKTQNMFCGVPRISPYGYGVVPNFATPCGCNGVTF